MFNICLFCLWNCNFDFRKKMPPRKKREPSTLPNEHCVLGWMFLEERQKCVDAFNDKVDEGYVWIQEVLVEIKRSLLTSEVELCPKTPSKERKRVKAKESSISSTRSTRVRGKGSGAWQDVDSSVASAESQDESQQQSGRPTRSTRASSRANSSKSKATRSTRSQKSQKQAAEDAEEEDEERPEPAVSLYKEEITKTVSFDDKKSATEKQDGVKVDAAVEEDTSSTTAQPDRAQSETDETVKSPSKKVLRLSNSVDVNNTTPTNQPPKAKATPSPISAIKTAIRASVNKSVQGSSPRSNSPRTQSPLVTSHSPRPVSASPVRSGKSIPNFNTLSVKQKASAYEQHVTKKPHAYDSACSGTSDDNASPRKLAPKQTNNKKAMATAGAEEHVSRLDVPSTGATPSRSRSPLGSRLSPSRGEHLRRSTRRSSTARRVSGVRSGVRMSLSRKRSSIMRHKLRTSQVTSKQAKEEINATIKSSPEKTSTPVDDKGSGETRSHVIAHLLPTSKPFVKKRMGYQGKTGAAPPASTRSTRSKLRLHKLPGSAVSTATTDSADSAATGASSCDERMDMDEVDGEASPLPTPPPSDERKNQATSTPAAKGSSGRVTILSHRQVDLGEPRGSMSVKRQAPEKLSHRRVDSGEPRASMSMKRQAPEEAGDGSDEQTPPKRRFVDSEGDEDIVEGTPQANRTGSGTRIIKPVRGGGESAQRGLNNSAVKSFIQRNTPLKKSFKEAEEERRKQVESKNKEADRRIAKREEQQQKRRLEIKRQREERQRRVESRRKEQEKSDFELKHRLEQKLGGVKSEAKKALEDKVREEREKRERKMAEAEQKRKQLEAVRLQKLKEQEEEKRRQEEQRARERAEEEKERTRRAAEQQKQEEERRAALEKEREREEEARRQAEEEKRRRHEAERLQREEIEKRERAEREKLELQRQEERERQKREEQEKAKEQELRRLREERAKEQERMRDEREVQSMIKKHNSALQSNTSLNTSGGQQQQQAQRAPVVQQTLQLQLPKLNSSYTLTSKPVPPQQHTALQQHARTESQDSTDSYDMTPVRKVHSKKSTEENYCIDDIKSDDSTDEEEAPRKKIPNWAAGSQLKASLIHQYYQPPDLDAIFDTVVPPDLNNMFIKKRPRFNKRTSSAMWDSPILKPSGALPT